MSEPTEVLARAILDELGIEYGSTLPKDVSIAISAALDAAGYQIVQKPLELTSGMAALCQQEAVHIFKARRIPGMRDG